MYDLILDFILLYVAGLSVFSLLSIFSGEMLRCSDKRVILAFVLWPWVAVTGLYNHFTGKWPKWGFKWVNRE